MAYIINDTRGQIVAVVEDGTFDTTSTDVVLIGRGITDYGDQQNTNFVWLMENFANDTAPPLPLQGQLWYNTSDNTLYVRNTSDLWTGLVDLASTQAFTGQKSFVGGIIAGSGSYPNTATYSFYDGTGGSVTDTAISYNSGSNSLLVNLNGVTKITVSTSSTTFSSVIRPNAGIQFPDSSFQSSAGGDAFLANTQTFTGVNTFAGGIIAGDSGLLTNSRYSFYDGSANDTAIYYASVTDSLELDVQGVNKLSITNTFTQFHSQIRTSASGAGIRFSDGTIQTSGWNGTYNYADVFLAGTQTFTGLKSFVGGIIAGSSEYPGTASYNFYDGNPTGSTTSIIYRPDISAVELSLFNDVKTTWFNNLIVFWEQIRVDGGIRFIDGTVQTSAAPAAYSLPIATTSTLGGVKADGTSIVVSPTGVLSANLTAALANYVTLGTVQDITNFKSFQQGIGLGSAATPNTAKLYFYDSVGPDFLDTYISFNPLVGGIQITVQGAVIGTFYPTSFSLTQRLQLPAAGIRFNDGTTQVTAATGGSSYTLPTATTTILGGVKVDGTSIVINGSGVISAVGGGGGGDATLGTTQTFTGQKTFAGGFILGNQATPGQAKVTFYDAVGTDKYDTYISYTSAAESLFFVINNINTLIVSKTFVGVGGVPLYVAPAGIIFSDGSTQTSAASGGGYVLPTASTTVKGGVKVDGTSIVVDGSGVISAVGGGGGGDATLGGTQTFTGQKTFSNGFILGNAANPTKTVVNFYDGMGGDLYNTAVYYKPSDNLIAVSVQGDVIANFYTDKLSVVKQLWLSSTGVRFADGTVQTTATSNNTTGWDVHYTNVNYSIGGTYVLPTGTIGIYANCEVGALYNTGGYGYVEVYTSSHELIGSLWINGTNTRIGPDGGSGMWDSAASFLPVPATASYVVFRFQGTATQYVTFKLLGYVLGAVTASYSLPVATSSVLGGVKIGSGITVAVDGTISVGSTGYSTLGGDNTFTGSNGFIGNVEFTDPIYVLDSFWWNSTGTVGSRYINDEIRFINDSFTPLTVRERSVLVSGQDAFALQVTNNLSGGSSGTALDVVATSGAVNGITVSNTSSTLTAAPIAVDASRTSASTFDLIVANTSAGTVQETSQFVVRGDGSTFIRGNYSTAAADYAEYFESLDNTPIDIGATVVLINGKIRAATNSDNVDDIMGVVRPKNSSCTSVIGNNPWGEWDKKYLTDDFGEYILDTHVVYEWDEEVDGATVRHSYEDWNIPAGIIVPNNATCISTDTLGNPLQHRRINPDYDPSQTYVPRQSRDNWFVVGLLGQVPVRKGQPINPRWKLMQTRAGQADLYFIR